MTRSIAPQLTTLPPGRRARPVTAPPTPRSLSDRLPEALFIFVLCQAQLISLAGMNITVAPLLLLAKYFDIHDYGKVSWFSAAYSMTAGTFILPAGRLGEIYGHKRIFMVGWVWFAMWSLIAGFCNESHLIFFSVCRAFQGIGPALLIPNAIAIIGRSFPAGLKRNIAFACFGAAGPIGATVGTVFAALASQYLTWHWCFWLLAITCTAMIFISHFFVPDHEAQDRITPYPLPGRRWASSKLARLAPALDQPVFDWPGAITGVSGLTIVNFTLNQAPIVGWSEPYIPALLALRLLFLVAFVWVELRVATQPIIPIRGLQRNAAFTLACVFAGWSSHGIWIYYLYIFLEHLRGHGVLLTAAEMSPVAVTGVLFAFSTVWLMMRRVAVSWVMLVSMVFFLVGSLIMAVTPIEQTYWANTFLAIVLMPGAMNLSFPAATMLLSSALPKEKQGIAASLVATVVNYSISCGLGFAGSIHKHSLEFAAERAGLTGPPPALSVSNPVLIKVRLFGLRAGFWFAVGLGGLGILIAALFIFVQREETARSAMKGENAHGMLEARKSLSRASSGDTITKPHAAAVRRWSIPSSPDSPTSPETDGLGGGGKVNTFYIGDKVLRVTERKSSVT